MEDFFNGFADRLCTSNSKRGPKPSELKEVWTWRGNLGETNYIDFLEYLTAYLNCMKISEKEIFQMSNSAMIDPVQGWFQLVRNK